MFEVFIHEGSPRIAGNPQKLVVVTLCLSNLYDRMNTDTILDETFVVERYGEKSKTLPNFEQGNVTFPAGLSRRIVQDRLCVPGKWTTGMSDIKLAVDFFGCLFFKFDR